MTEDLSNIKLDMELFKGNYTKDDLDFYCKMLSKYQNDIEMIVTWSGSFGDVELLNKLSDSGEYNPLSITPVESWNYLHKCNLNSSAPYPLNVIKFYIDKGVEVNAQDGYGMTPLHYAMQAKNGDAALALLEAGANPNIPNRDNVIPLGMMGAMPHRLDVLKKMLENGGDVHYKNGNSGMELLEFAKHYLSDIDGFKGVIELMEQYA